MGLPGLWEVSATVTRSGVYEAEVRISGLAGLAATYYGDAFLRAPVASMLEPKVDHDWGASAPHSLVNADYFSSRYPLTPSTLHPTPHTPHSTPYTLHPSPFRV